VASNKTGKFGTPEPSQVRITPSVLEKLVEEFNIMPITTPEADLTAALA
jgi:hydroxylamine reductase (hybrid-cluster protein)